MPQPFWNSMKTTGCDELRRYEDLAEGNIDFDPWCNYDFTYCLFTCNVAETWVDDDYCPGCPNDGHVWILTPFANYCRRY